MPQTTAVVVQQVTAAAASARVRTTRRLARDLRATKPLTTTQRNELLAAVIAIPVLDGVAK